VQICFDASRGRKEAVLRLLLAAGTDSDGGSTNGETPLSVSSRLGRMDLVRLLDAGADPAPLEWTELLREAALGTAEGMADLLRAGAR
jgi:hypothetical protein